MNYNSFLSGTIPISVPNKQETITIETNTFRDKLQPGAEETWSFTIKNDKNNKVTAEVLASMYDASLDEFKAHNWQFNPITTSTYYSYGSSANAYQSFGNEHFRVFNRNYPNSYYPTQQYDRLNWFGFSFGRNRNILLRGTSKRLKNGISEPEAIMEEAEVEDSSVPFLSKDASFSPPPKKVLEKVSLEGIQIRKNLQETAFFYPHLTTDKKGDVTFSFTTNFGWY